MDNNSFSPSGQGSDNSLTPPNPPESINTQTPLEVPLASAPNPLINTEPTPAPEPAPAPESTPEPVPVSSPVPAPELIPAPAPVPTPEPAPISAPELAPTPMPEPVSAPAPTSEPAQTPAPHKKSSAKLFYILGTCLILAAIIIVVLFLVPFGDKTLWDSMTGGIGSGGSSGSGSGGSSQSGKSVTTGGYTYTTNLDLEYEPGGTFHEGLLAARDSDGNAIYLDTAGKVAFKLDSTKYRRYGSFSNGLLAVSCISSGEEDGPSGASKYGYVDKTGELVIPCQYKYAEEFMNGYAAVAVERDESETGFSTPKYGVIDTKGNLVVDYQYENIRYESGTFLNKKFRAEKYDSEYSLNTLCVDIDSGAAQKLVGYSEKCAEDPDVEEGKQIVSALEEKYENEGKNYNVGDYSEGLILVYSQSPLEFFFVDANGNKVWSVDTDNVVDADDDGYEEGLFRIYMWVADEPRPSLEELETMMRDENEMANLYSKVAAVFYDHSGNPVFMYRYSRSSVTSTTYSGSSNDVPKYEIKPQTED